MPPGRRRHLTMPQKALLHDPDLVGIAPVSPTRDLPSRKDLDLGSELMVGHKVGLIIAVEISSDGSRRRLTMRALIADMKANPLPEGAPGLPALRPDDVAVNEAVEKALQPPSQ